MYSSVNSESQNLVPIFTCILSILISDNFPESQLYSCCKTQGVHEQCTKSICYCDPHENILINSNYPRAGPKLCTYPRISGLKPRYDCLVLVFLFLFNSSIFYPAQKRKTKICQGGGEKNFLACARESSPQTIFPLPGHDFFPPLGILFKLFLFISLG